MDIGTSNLSAQVVQPPAELPPKKGMHGCLLAFLIALGLVVVGVPVGIYTGGKAVVDYAKESVEKAPLYLAVAANNISEVDRLIAEGANPDEKALAGHSPLIMAASCDSSLIAEHLLQAGANPNQKDSLQWAPLHHAVKPAGANLDMISILVRYKADVNITDKHLRTPLHRAAQFGHVEAVKLLLQLGANPNAKDENGWTPLDRGAAHPAIRQILETIEPGGLDQQGKATSDGSSRPDSSSGEVQTSTSHGSDDVSAMRRKAEQGDAEAQFWLGVAYMKGRGGVPQNIPEAVQWIHLAAKQGNAEALLDPVVAGGGVPQDYTEAAKWYRRAADQGHLPAQGALGAIYYFGIGVPLDYTEALKWCLLAADRGNATAQGLLGAAYATGTGVPQNDEESVKWYRKAAQQGDAIVQTSLGAAYEYGKGVPQDYKEAVKWYRLAAEQSDTGAQYALGVAYTKGNGVKQDYKEAVMWYRLAAEQGEVLAQLNLGCSYANGAGVSRDYSEAYAWLNLAAVQGNQYAAKMREVALKLMTPAQIEEGQRLSREYAEKFGKK